MPPRVNKKSTTTAAARTTHYQHNDDREGQEHTTKLREHEDANFIASGSSEPSEPSHVASDPPQESTSHSQSQDPTQSGPGPAEEQLIEMMSGMVQSQNKRHKVAKSSISKSYKASVSTTKSSITTLFDEHEAKSARTHSTHQTRLRKLLDEKRKVELEMAKLVNAQRARYQAYAADLEAVVCERGKRLG